MKVLIENIFVILCCTCVACDSVNGDKQNTNLKFEDTTNQLNINIRGVFNQAVLLKEIPDSNFLDVNHFPIIADSIFVNEFFPQNKGLYYNNDSIVKEDFSLESMVEYNFFPKEVYEKNKVTISLVGKLEKAAYNILIVKYYDVNTSRFYFMTFDKKDYLLSSICFYGYHTGDNADIYNSKDKKYSNAFISYRFSGYSIQLQNKGFIDIDFELEIQPSGKIFLLKQKKT